MPHIDQHWSLWSDNTQTHGKTEYHNVFTYVPRDLISKPQCATMIKLCYYLNFVENCIGAKVFSNLTEEEINDPSLDFSFGGKKLLNMTLVGIKVRKLITEIQ